MKKYIIVFLLIFISLLFFFFSPFEKKEESLLEQKTVYREEGGGDTEESEILEDILTSCQLCNLIPIRDHNVPLPELGEEAGIAILFGSTGKATTLYQKNIGQILPIASLTKLMSAMIIIDNYPLDKQITVSQRAVWTEGESGRLSPGEKITIKDLLYLSLLVSSNDASTALAEFIGYNKFVELMNEKANEIGLLNTNFANPHGLDEKENYSTAEDLALLTQYSILHYSSIWDILGVKEIDIISKDHLNGKILHHVRNTNSLILKEGVIGGKTGYTEEAKDTMILAIKAPGKVRGNVILVLLGVDDRIQRSEELYNWLKIGYIWE